MDSDDLLYDVLGLAPDAPQRAVWEAFLSLIEKMQGATRSPVTTPALGAAYRTLSDFDARCRFNAERGLPAPPAPSDAEREGLRFMDELFAEPPGRPAGRGAEGREASVLDALVWLDPSLFDL